MSKEGDQGVIINGLPQNKGMISLKHTKSIFQQGEFEEEHGFITVDLKSTILMPSSPIMIPNNFIRQVRVKKKNLT